MPTINGTVKGDKWMVINPGVYTFDGLAGVDIIAWGTSQRSSYQIYQGSDGVVRVDSVSGASQSLNASLYSIEKMTFDSGRETVDLRIEFPDAVNKLLVGTVTADAFTSTTENDGINGQQGIDSVAFRGSHANYTVNKVTNFGFTIITVKDKTSADGTDTLQSVERLQFLDKKIAFDLDGNAGQVSKILGAVFGTSSVTNKSYVGIGLSYLDQGMSYTDLMQLAIDASLGGRGSNTDVVNLLYTNVVGSAPDAETLAYFKGLLDNGSFTQGSLGVLAADTSINITNINLVGLALTGVEFV